MKVKGWILSLIIGWFGTQISQAQSPPPNDNYSNRTVLSGTQLTFSGTLAGATLESPVETNTYGYYWGMPAAKAAKSIWWSWTAPLDTELTLQILSSSDTNDGSSALMVYSATNGSSSPAGLIQPPLGVQGADFWQTAPVTLSIPVRAGNEYEFQLIGSNSLTYTIALIATNKPIIVEQPKNRTVYSNACVLFYVFAAGLGQTNFTFQWLFNGTTMNGETAPMLSLTNVDGSMAGNYSVMVSNTNGFTISQPAVLTVSQSNYPIYLSTLESKSKSFSFSLTGEPFREYLIQSSSNLINWTNQISGLATQNSYNSQDTSPVLYNTNLTSLLNVTNDSSRKFFRALPYVTTDSDAALCIHHLAEIRIAKLLWLRDYSALNPAGVPYLAVIQRYFPHQVAPYCPYDTNHLFTYSYTINDLHSYPTCVVSPFSLNHKLIDPR